MPLRIKNFLMPREPFFDHEMKNLALSNRIATYSIVRPRALYRCHRLIHEAVAHISQINLCWHRRITSPAVDSDGMRFMKYGAPYGPM